VVALRRWIAGERSVDTRWCTWRIPLHIGGLSDPLQPLEREQRRTLAAEAPWLDVLSACNVVLQVSMVAPTFDRWEPGAPSYAARLRMLPILARRVTRLVVRCQPYTPAVFGQVLRALPRYRKAAVWGVVFESLKRKRPAPGTVKVGADWCLPVDVLEPDFLRLRDRCRALSLAFLAAENRCRRLSDSRCCCGTAGLAGFQPNTANLNTLLFGGRLRFRAAMEAPGSGHCFKALAQSPVSSIAMKRPSYAECMRIVAAVPTYRAVLGLAEHPPRRSAPAR
jgi:hypothetical protein